MVVFLVACNLRGDDMKRMLLEVFFTMHAMDHDSDDRRTDQRAYEDLLDRHVPRLACECYGRITAI